MSGRTETAKNSRLLVKAAQMLFDGDTNGFSNSGGSPDIAIGCLTKNYSEHERLRGVYREVFEPFPLFDSRDEAVLSLCLAAAVVASGDA